MVGRKVIFIIPGFRQKITQKAYRELAKNFKKEGYSPILVDIAWKGSTLSENTEYFLNVFKEIKADKKYILGFSYGAMIAFIAATKVRVSGLVLCSLSPYFKEDLLRDRSKIKSSLMEARYNDLCQYKSKALSQKLKVKKILMLYGSEEARSLIMRVRKTFSEISSSRKYLVPVLKSDHEIGNPRYLSTIHTVIQDLL